MAKVLVIDDEKTIGTLMSRIIGRMGHMVEYAETIFWGTSKELLPVRIKQPRV